MPTLIRITPEMCHRRRSRDPETKPVVLNIAARPENRKGSAAFSPGRSHHNEPKLRQRITIFIRLISYQSSVDAALPECRGHVRAVRAGWKSDSLLPEAVPPSSVT